ncbi:MAG TPA: hypothetical protein VF062_27365 [Candidatus Limnocylindrales bacterium]
MNANPSLDPLYLAARQVLLDALGALSRHLDALVLVGAQAIYLHTDDAELDIAIAPFTADADLAVDTRRLPGEPQLAKAMLDAGFSLKIKSAGGVEPGSWIRQVDVDGRPRTVPVDLIVPAALADGHGRRDARLPAHGERAARWANGLEAAVIDNAPMRILSLEPHADAREATVKVASVAALLIAKCHKIHERLDQDPPRPVRIKSKDAGDVIRLMRGSTTPSEIGATLALLSQNSTAGASVVIGFDYLRKLFEYPRSPGVTLAADALRGALTEEEVRVVAPEFVSGVVGSYLSRLRR